MNILTDEEIRNDTLRRCIASMYYYLELDEEDMDEELLFKYKLRWSRKMFDALYYAHEDDDEKFKTALKKELIHRLCLTDIKEILNYKYMSDEYNPHIVYVTVTARISKKEYLDSLCLMLQKLVPWVDIYNDRIPIDLEGVAQKYGLNYLKPLYSPEDESPYFPDPRLY